MTMLTTNGSQYLHPDYLQPLPTTLDAKKSPLALLAQTCSSIGKDTTPAKTIIPPLEKKEREKTPDKSGNHDNGKRPSSTAKKETGRDSRSGSKTVPSGSTKDVPALVPVTNTSCDNSEGKKQSEIVKSNSRSSPENENSQRPISANGFQASGKTSKEIEQPDLTTTSQSLSPHSKSSAHQSSSFSFGGLRTPSVLGHPSLLSGLPPAAHLGYPHLSFVNPYDIPVSASGYPAHFAAQANLSAAAAAAAAQNSILKANAAAASAAAMSPYVAYTRVRTPSGATTLVPVCRDPYCSNCQLTLQNSHVSSSCSLPGCAQCAHEKSLNNLTAGFGYPASSLSLLPSLSAAGSFPGIGNSLSSLYHPGALAAHQGLPFICNWVAGSDYCGKRFTTSEELLQHLKTHTSSMDSLPANLATSYGFGLPPHLAVSHGLYPHSAPPPSLSPNSLRRAYPTSLSPVSSLLAASRFHPYKAPLSGGPAAGSQPYQSLPAYYSPYGLYGQRIGAAAVP